MLIIMIELRTMLKFIIRTSIYKMGLYYHLFNIMSMVFCNFSTIFSKKL